MIEFFRVVFFSVFVFFLIQIVLRSSIDFVIDSTNIYFFVAEDEGVDLRPDFGG